MRYQNKKTAPTGHENETMQEKMIFWCRVKYTPRKWHVASARFQKWARSFGLTDEESYAYLMAAQGRLGEMGTTKADYIAAKNILDWILPDSLDFSINESRPE